MEGGFEVGREVFRSSSHYYSMASWAQPNRVNIFESTGQLITRVKGLHLKMGLHLVQNPRYANSNETTAYTGVGRLNVYVVLYYV